MVIPHLLPQLHDLLLGDPGQAAHTHAPGARLALQQGDLLIVLRPAVQPQLVQGGPHRLVLAIPHPVLQQYFYLHHRVMQYFYFNQRFMRNFYFNKRVMQYLYFNQLIMQNFYFNQWVMEYLYFKQQLLQYFINKPTVQACSFSYFMIQLE
jgi:hypothetical protein